MASYNLDNLGWYQFEELVQSLLNARFEAAIEAWGVSADWGRDAYYEQPLPFPDAGNIAPAPIVFQAKFISEANAAGAKPGPALTAAVKAEAKRNAARPSKLGRLGTYVLLTNAPITAKLRTDLQKLIIAKFGSEQAFVFGSGDLCAWLNDVPGLRRSFPQILGLRDLSHLLSEVVAKPTLERSNISIEDAQELSTVFVPTARYSDAWKRLATHGFIVLEGPPEVGKTAIARMIALTQHCAGWSAYECVQPDDFLRVYEKETNQVFVADDAFGSTQYDPTSTRLWARDLDRILRRVDDRHWLIWTARKHILQMALKDAHLQGRAERFPSPGDVLVDVGDLNTREKALMLYRHAKAARLSQSGKDAVRKVATSVVNSEHFTPERIRRLVSVRMDTLLETVDAPELSQTVIDEVVERELANPTIAMVKSFRALPDAHRSLLFSMLDVEKWQAKTGDYEAAFERHSPPGVESPFSIVHTELLHAFIRLERQRSQEVLAWIHPSLGDLVIEELAASAMLRRDFLSKSKLPGIRLALSRGGGRTGERALPLLRDEEDWIVLQDRLTQLVAGGDRRLHRNVLALLSSASSAEDQSTSDSERLQNVVAAVLRACRSAWDSREEPIRNDSLRKYFSLAGNAADWIPAPDLSATWTARVTDLRQELEDWSDRDATYEGGSVLRLAGLVAIFAQYEPRYLLHVKWPDSVVGELRQALEACDGYRAWLEDVEADDPPAPDFVDAARELAGALKVLSAHTSELAGAFSEAATEIQSEATGLEERIEEHEREADEDDDAECYSGGAITTSGFSDSMVSAIFKDL